MPTPVSYLSGASLSNTVGMFKRGTIAQNLKTSLESGYRWWNGIEVTSSQYLIYSDTFTLGTTTQANATPVAYSTPDLTDQSLLNLINTLPPRIGQTAFTSLPIALQWLQSSNKFFLIRGGTENIVKSNLKLYVDAGRFDSYIGSGTTWSDLSGNNNNGTLVNGTGYNSSGVGSMVFDGSDDYVNCGNGITTTTQITVSAWVKLNVNNIFQHIVDSANNTWHLAVLSDGRLYFWDGNVYHTNGDILSTGKWYHVVGVKTATTNDIYVNGILSSSLNSNVSIPTNNVWIGRWQPPGDGRVFNGNISNVQIYDAALTPQQILQNFNAQKYRFGYYDSVQDGLIFDLDAGNYLSYPRSGTTWTDLTGKGNNGTLINGPTFSGGTTPSIVFDGSDDYVNLTTATTLGINNVSTSFTISTWFKVAVAGEYYLLDNYNGSTQDISFRIDSGKFEVYLMASAGGGFNAVQFGGGYSNGIWTNFTLIWNGSDTIIAYANGINIGSSTKFGMTGNFDSGTAFQIGARPSASSYFPGNISIVQIYNRALSPQEIIQNFESQRVYYGVTGITTNGLVLNLDAANNASYNGSGTTWVDISGSEFDGTLINGPTYSNSGTSSSISFDGTDDYARVSDINTASEISIEGWVYANSVGSFNAIASQFKADTLAESSWVLETVGSDIRLYITNNSLLSFASTSFSTLVWTYIVGTFNGTTIKIYKNSVLGDITGTIAGLNDSNLNINIGALYSQNGSEGGTGLWNGKIANVKIYNRALSQAEVLNNYNATKSRFGL